MHKLQKTFSAEPPVYAKPTFTTPPSIPPKQMTSMQSSSNYSPPSIPPKHLAPIQSPPSIPPKHSSLLKAVQEKLSTHWNEYSYKMTIEMDKLQQINLKLKENNVILSSDEQQLTDWKHQIEFHLQDLKQKQMIVQQNIRTILEFPPLDPDKIMVPVDRLHQQ